MLTPEAIAKITNSKLDQVQKIWPMILVELGKQGMSDRASIVAIAATVGVECHFCVIHERGARAYFDRYIGILGNKDSEMAYKYRGRGLVQLTGYENYAKYGKLTGLDLVNNPDLALEPVNAVKILVAYFKDHGVNVWANRGSWLKVRELVNGRRRSAKNPRGKPNGWADFIEVVWELIEEVYK